MRRKTTIAAGLAAAGLVAATVALATPAAAATLTEVTNFGYNPTSARMYEYVPNNAPARPAMLVAVHWCGGSGPAMYSGTELATFADQYGFIVLYPSVTSSRGCWDVASAGALTRNGNSDPAAINSMVQWELQNRGVDPGRVYVVGISSGAMMNNVLAANYPDVYKAGSAFMGVPYYCFFTGEVGGWNGDCGSGRISKTAQEWGDLARSAYPGYTGPRPRMQLWHGVLDEGVHYNNLAEMVKQWTNVLGVSQTPTFTDRPASNWTRHRYGGSGTMAPVESNSFDGVGHSLPLAGQMRLAMEFLGLIGGPTSPTTAPTTRATTPPTTRVTTPPSTPPTTPPTSRVTTPPTTQVTTPPTTSGGGASCRVATTISAWSNGLVEGITITNTGTSTINGWSLVFTLPGGQTIGNGWNATYAPPSGQVTATSVSYNATLAPGANTSIGFQAGHTGNSGAPTGFTLNGTACTVA
jgi:poly(hydroxyalkanoate) depolymerase family esterase